MKIDGCVITDGPRCDFLVLVEGREDEVYIELKGSDVGHAMEQLEATIPRVSGGTGTVVKWCYVECARVPPFVQTRIQRQKTRFARRYNAKLTVGSHLEHVL